MQGGYPPQGPNAPPPGGPFGQGPNNNAYGGYGPPPPQPGMPMAPFPGGPGGPGINPGAPYGVDPVTGIPFSDKSKIIAGLLQLFLGCFGAGRFYTGHTGIAVAQLIVGWLTCGIWPFIDGIMMLMGKVTDAQGRPLRDGT